MARQLSDEERHGIRILQVRGYSDTVISRELEMPRSTVRNQRPEVRAKMREYKQRPEVKEREREHYQKNRDKILRRQREYSQRPEVKERIKEYWQRPEVKEKRRREYEQRPEVKARGRKYHKENQDEILEKKRKYKTYDRKPEELADYDAFEDVFKKYKESGVLEYDADFKNNIYVKIVAALETCPKNQLKERQIRMRVNVKKGLITKHLQRLESLGLIDINREAPFNSYSLNNGNKEFTGALLEELLAAS